MNSGLTLGTSYGLHANTSTFYIRSSKTFILSPSSMLDPIWKYLSVSGNILTFSSPLALVAPFSSWYFCNCYNGISSATSFCSVCSSFQWPAAIRHCQATFWFPLTVATPYSVQNLTFICRLDGMALIAWIHGLPKIVVYGENELTTMNVAVTSLPSMLTRREIWPWGITTLPLKETNRELYLARSWFFNPSPLNRSRYIISAPLPWSIITLFTKNPFIRALSPTHHHMAGSSSLNPHHRRQ